MVIERVSEKMDGKGWVVWVDLGLAGDQGRPGGVANGAFGKDEVALFLRRRGGNGFVQSPARQRSYDFALFRRSPFALGCWQSIQAGGAVARHAHDKALHLGGLERCDFKLAIQYRDFSGRRLLDRFLQQ